MAKKKKNIAQPQQLSPQRYIKEKARNLPVAECYWGGEWKERGMTIVIVARQHKHGNYTVGFYQVDTFCKGVTSSSYLFNTSEKEYTDFLDNSDDNLKLMKCTYPEAHNLIYGAVGFAEEAGIQPDKSFQLTQYILEEDTESVPLIEYDFGKDGTHFLVADTWLEANTYLPLLEENLGDEFEYVVRDTEEEEDNDDEAALGTTLDRLKNLFDSTKHIQATPYLYKRPAYPVALEMENAKLLPLFYESEYQFGFPEEKLAEILSLPREGLVRDLEHLTLFETGCTCDEIPAERLQGEYITPLVHTLFLLGELRSETSLPIVLETLRQEDFYYDFHFGDARSEVYVPTLYLLGQNNLSALMDYIKEPGLDTFARCLVFSAVALIVSNQPERRAEVIEWFREVLVFYREKISEVIYCDGNLASMMVNELIDMKAEELLPEIKALYDTGLVDEFGCGNYEKVETLIRFGTEHGRQSYPLDIYERYREYKARWNR